MAEEQLPIPDFVDVDAEAVAAAEAAAKERSGGAGWSIPETVTISEPTGKKNQRHARWTEEGTIKTAYRTVTKSGLIDVTLVIASRTGQPNEGKSNFFHFYINAQVMANVADEETVKKHGSMNEQSLGAIATLLRATGLMPTSGRFTGSLLNTIFPQKNQPGTSSPLNGKSCVVNVHATVEKKMKTDEATGEVTETDDVRVQGDTFLPATE